MRIAGVRVQIYVKPSEIVRSWVFLVKWSYYRIWRRESLSLVSGLSERADLQFLEDETAVNDVEFDA